MTSTGLRAGVESVFPFACVLRCRLSTMTLAVRRSTKILLYSTMCNSPAAPKPVWTAHSSESLPLPRVLNLGRKPPTDALDSFSWFVSCSRGSVAQPETPPSHSWLCGDRASLDRRCRSSHRGVCTQIFERRLEPSSSQHPSLTPRALHAQSPQP